MRFEAFSSRELAVLRKALKMLCKNGSQSDSFVSSLLLAEIEQPIDLIRYIQKEPPTKNEGGSKQDKFD